MAKKRISVYAKMPNSSSDVVGDETSSQQEATPKTIVPFKKVTILSDKVVDDAVTLRKDNFMDSD
jgi:hypothetical protein